MSKKFYHINGVPQTTEDLKSRVTTTENLDVVAIPVEAEIRSNTKRTFSMSTISEEAWARVFGPKKN